MVFLQTFFLFPSYPVTTNEAGVRSLAVRSSVLYVFRGQMFRDAPVSTKAPDISFSATLAVRCRGEVLASGGISFSSSSVKLRIGKDVSDDKCRDPGPGFEPATRWMNDYMNIHI
ncbi:hypothetical protein AAC387_Pa02g2184 [Persea americana]